MFDLLGWMWEYEPIDLAGYIPDFIVQLSEPLLVEVKPILRWPCAIYGCSDCSEVLRDTYDETCRTIMGSGWDGDWSVSGAALLNCGQHSVIGLLRAVWVGMDLGGQRWADNAVLLRSKTTGAFDLFPDIAYFDDDGNPAESIYRGREPFDPTPLWREAGNRVQWRAPEVRR